VGTVEGPYLFPGRPLPSWRGHLTPHPSLRLPLLFGVIVATLLSTLNHACKVRYWYGIPVGLSVLIQYHADVVLKRLNVSLKISCFLYEILTRSRPTRAAYTGGIRKSRYFKPLGLSRCISETVRDKDIDALVNYTKIACLLSNRVVRDDLGWPLKVIFVSSVKCFINYIQNMLSSYAVT